MKSRIESMLGALEVAAYNRYRAHLRRRRPLPAGLPAPAYSQTPSPWRRKAVVLTALAGTVASITVGGYELAEYRKEAQLRAEWDQAVHHDIVLVKRYSQAHVNELKQRGLLGEEKDFREYMRVVSDNPPQAPELVRLKAEVELSNDKLDALAPRMDQLHD